MAITSFALLLISIAQPVSDQCSWSWNAIPGPYSAGLIYGKYEGSATISVEKPVVELGKRYTVEIRFTNSGAPAEIFNPGFNQLLPLPGALVLFDKDNECLGGLFLKVGSQRAVEPRDWITIPSSTFIGCHKTFTAGRTGKQSDVAPGNYFLQLIYFKVFVAANPWRFEDKPSSEDKQRLQRFYDSYDGTELFRSNVVAIRFVGK